MHKIEISSSSRYPVRRKEIKEVIKRTLLSFGVEQNCLVEINVVGDRKMTRLHKEFLKEEGTTDVMSFPLQEDYLDKGKDDFIDNIGEILRLGTIFVSYPQARRQANLHHLSIDKEISQLVEHGVMHLLGIHHEGH